VQIEPGLRQVVSAKREYTSGRSTRDIAADLTREGVPSPGAAHYKNKAGRPGIISASLAVATVAALSATSCISARYIGMFAQQFLNPETQKKQKRPNPEERHTIVKNAELRIIPQALWDSAQKVRSERAIHMFGPTGKPRRRPVVPRNSEHPLAGALRGGVCNGHMRIAQSSRNGGPRAACANAHARGTCEHTHSFDMDVLLKDRADKMEVRLLSPKAIEEAMTPEINATRTRAVTKRSSARLHSCSKVTDAPLTSCGRVTTSSTSSKTAGFRKSIVIERTTKVKPGASFRASWSSAC
jgi:hypothetical protein